MQKGKFALIAVLWLLTATHAQQAPDAPFRVTVNLVQVDAVVTDRSGNHVTDLKLEDFEVLQNGKPQRLTNCTYIPTGPAKITAPAAGPAPARLSRSFLRAPAGRSFATAAA